MTIELNHTIVWARDPERSARFLAEMLGKPPPYSFGRFRVVELDNAVQLDFARTQGTVQQAHYAFLIDEAEFDTIFARIEERGLPYWADPMQSREGEINRNDGGRGIYFHDPDDHLLEMITRPYGSGE